MLVITIRTYLIIFLSFVASKIFAQDSTLKYNASIMLSGASAATPFWIQANQNGTIPNSGNFGTGQFGVYKIYNPNNPRILQWSAGAELIASYGTSTKLFASDLYVASKIGHFEILAGQKKHMTGLADTLLTSGSLSVSGNSRPIPRLQIAMPEFYPLFLQTILYLLKPLIQMGFLMAQILITAVQDIYLRPTFIKKLFISGLVTITKN